MKRPFCALASRFTFRMLLGACLVLVGIAQSPGSRASAQCGPNAIVCENQNTGAPASEWDVSGSGDPTIQGFATDMSVNRGQTVHFKINTDATDYQITIYRLGYYGGLGARQLGVTGPLPSVQLPQIQ